MFAAQFSYDVTKFLLDDRGFDANYVFSEKDVSSISPLHIAAEYNQINTVKLLLERGAAVDSVVVIKTALPHEPNGVTSLHIAAITGFVHVAEVLLKNGANVNAKCKAGRTPLTFAIEHGHGEMINFLKANGGSD